MSTLDEYSKAKMSGAKQQQAAFDVASRIDPDIKSNPEKEFKDPLLETMFKEDIKHLHQVAEEDRQALYRFRRIAYTVLAVLLIAFWFLVYTVATKPVETVQFIQKHSTPLLAKSPNYSLHNRAIELFYSKPLEPGEIRRLHIKSACTGKVTNLDYKELTKM